MRLVFNLIVELARPVLYFDISFDMYFPALDTRLISVGWSISRNIGPDPEFLQWYPVAGVKRSFSTDKTNKVVVAHVLSFFALSRTCTES